MMDRPRSDPGASSALGKLAGFVITVVVLAGMLFQMFRPMPDYSKKKDSNAPVLSESKQAAA